MLKLIKILNSGVNVPEILRIPKAAGIAIKAGSALTLADGSAANCAVSTMPMYIAAQNAAANDESITVTPVYENMLFETEIVGDPSSIKLGDKLQLWCDKDGAAVKVSSSTTSGVATVAELSEGLTDGGTLTVKF